MLQSCLSRQVLNCYYPKWEYNVIGDNPYFFDSDMCLAAEHSELLNNQEVILTDQRDGDNHFVGSMKNNCKSISSWRDDGGFRLSKAPNKLPTTSSMVEVTETANTTSITTEWVNASTATQIENASLDQYVTYMIPSQWLLAVGVLGSTLASAGYVGFNAYRGRRDHGRCLSLSDQWHYLKADISKLCCFCVNENTGIEHVPLQPMLPTHTTDSSSEDCNSSLI